MTTKGSDQAFPDNDNRGLTKREFFAAIILSGKGSAGMSAAGTSVLMADELIRALNTNKQPDEDLILNEKLQKKDTKNEKL